MLEKYKNKLIAHRGLYDNVIIPENSLRAFKSAITENYPIEIDIHLTKDNNLVVFHDHNLKRMTEKALIIENLTIDDLKEIRLLDTKEKIPTLGADAAMARGAMPYELAPTYVFLASDDSSYMTGQVMHVNGGEVMG